MVSERGKSTKTVIHDFLESFQKATEKAINQTEILFDLSKAYDALNHQILDPK